MFCVLFLKIAFAPLDYYLWSADKDKCYADKPQTIDALKDNICDAIGEIQLLKVKIMCLKIGPIVQPTAWPAEAAI